MASLWAHPLAGSGRSNIFLNEVGSNLNCKSYLEFFHEDGFADSSLLGLFLGLLILQPDTKKRKNNIIAAVDLKEIRQSPKDTQFFTLGNPDEQWKNDPENYYGSTIGNFLVLLSLFDFNCTF